MDSEELHEKIWPILYPEPDEDGYRASFPHKRLETEHGIDCSYWSPDEFNSGSVPNRLIRDPSDKIHDAVQSLTVPGSLSLAAVRLLGDSLLAHSDARDQWVKDGWGPFRFYPPVLITFWSGFEAFVRLQSEFLLAMSNSLPPAIRLALAEEEETVDERGRIKTKSRRRPVLDRYALLLKFGYSFEVDRGARFWQKAVAANQTRDALAHYAVSGAPSITCKDLWAHLEAISLLWIAPSAQINRSIWSQQYDCYEMIADLEPFLIDFEERPLHKGWARSGGVLVPCPMDGLDDVKYPPGGTFDPASTSLRAFRESKARGRPSDTDRPPS